MAKYRAQETRLQKVTDGKIQLEKSHLYVLNEYNFNENKISGKIENALGGRTQKLSESVSTAEWQLNQDYPSTVSHEVPQTILQIPSNLSLIEYSLPEKNFQQERLSECRVELDHLFKRLNQKYDKTIMCNRESSEDECTQGTGWKFNGTLIAHLCEHRAAVTRMVTLRQGGSMFASVSNDGFVRLWDCSKLDGHQNINRSRQFYAANTPLNSIASCDNGQSLAVASKDGALLCLRIDPTSSKMALQQARHLDSNTQIERTTHAGPEDGPVVEMQSKDQSQIVYATLFGAIVCWDLRMPSGLNSWRLQNDLRNGVITTFTIDPKNSSWLSIGTSSGRHLCWDLRFLLKIAEIKHPYESRIRRICPHPTEPSCLISASQGNNEVFSWNIETNSRQTALWASTAPPLSNMKSTTHSVCALLPGQNQGRGYLLTAGTDQKIRYWDLQDASSCRLVVPAPKDQASFSTVTYE